MCPEQNQRLTANASRFFDYGCRSSHLKLLGEALQGVLGEVLILNGLAPWGAPEAAAWGWFWGRLESAMRVTMDAHENDYADTVHNSWEMIKERYTIEAFGNIFYAEMQRTAPDLLTLFVRPKALQYSTFVQLMETLVQFAQDPEVFYQMVGVNSAAALIFSNGTFSAARHFAGVRTAGMLLAVRDDLNNCVTVCVLFATIQGYKLSPVRVIQSFSHYATSLTPGWRPTLPTAGETSFDPPHQVRRQGGVHQVLRRRHQQRPQDDPRRRLPSENPGRLGLRLDRRVTMHYRVPQHRQQPSHSRPGAAVLCAILPSTDSPL